MKWWIIATDLSTIKEEYEGMLQAVECQQFRKFRLNRKFLVIHMSLERRPPSTWPPARPCQSVRSSRRGWLGCCLRLGGCA